MMTAASNEVVAVIQADRDEAAALYGNLFPWADYFQGARCDEIRAGKWDMLKLVQAFARHRIAHSDPRPVAETDTVAFVQEWLMSSDHRPSQWDRDFAAAIDARTIALVAAELAEHFCATSLPDSVCADLCTTKQGAGRYGTNLMTVAEATDVLTRAIRAATRSPAPMAGGGWQGIATAPRDGTPFIATLVVHNLSGQKWWETHVIWADDETGEVASECEAGWSRVDDYSHWMPLPAPPAPAHPSTQEGGK
jgi:hypothetical protein